MTKPNKEYEAFDSAMRRLMAVSHAELKVALDAEKAAKKRKRKKEKKND